MNKKQVVIVTFSRIDAGCSSVNNLHHWRLMWLPFGVQRAYGLIHRMLIF